MSDQLYFKFLRKIRSLRRRHLSRIETAITRIHFAINRVQIGKGFSTNGIPFIRNNGGRFVVGHSFILNNGFTFNVIGRTLPCAFNVGREGELIIGNHVGISHSAIVCHKRVEIGDDTMIGANCVIYDTDFHPLAPADRWNFKATVATREVIIGRNVFIGAHSTIMKGSRIGDNSIIGAGSLVTGSVPANQIWAGNPAKYIRDL
jgi:acetyltransferase-like isoleucine patch superfamily enzyme